MCSQYVLDTEYVSALVFGEQTAGGFGAFSVHDLLSAFCYAYYPVCRPLIMDLPAGPSTALIRINTATTNILPPTSVEDVVDNQCDSSTVQLVASAIDVCVTQAENLALEAYGPLLPPQMLKTKRTLCSLYSHTSSLLRYLYSGILCGTHVRGARISAFVRLSSRPPHSHPSHRHLHARPG